MRDWSMATQSETPSSCPIRPSKLASVSSLTRPSLKLASKTVEQLHVAVFFAQFHLVDFADARLGQFVYEQYLFRDGVSGDDALVDKHLEMRFDDCVIGGVGARRILDHQPKRALAPSVISYANDCSFPHAGELRDQVLDLQRRHPFTAGLDDVLEAVGNMDIAIGRHDGDV